VHVSEMSWTQKIKHPSKVMAVGDTIEAQVLAVDPAAKRHFPRHQAGRPEPLGHHWAAIPRGLLSRRQGEDHHRFRAFVGIEEGIDGLIHISDMSWTKHVKHPSDILKKGQTARAVVLNIDAQKQRISLGLKQLTPDPWDKDIPARYR